MKSAAIFCVCLLILVASRADVSNAEHNDSKISPSRKPKTDTPSLFSNKKLNPFLLPTIMWLPYKNDRKKMIMQQKKGELQKILAYKGQREFAMDIYKKYVLNQIKNVIGNDVQSIVKLVFTQFIKLKLKKQIISQFYSKS